MISALLRAIGRLTPDVKYFRAVPNRLLWPIHRTLGLKGGVVQVLEFKMRLDPSECVDRNLWFAPHLYDNKEIALVEKLLREKGTLNVLDIGANIGFWSLLVAGRNKDSSICAIEANPSTYEILRENVEINSLRNVTIHNKAISNHAGEVLLYCNLSGNRGGDSCVPRVGRSVITVRAVPLCHIVDEMKWDRVDFMKIDIEGLELPVLKGYYRDAARKRWPKIICIEVSHSKEAAGFLQSLGYQCEGKFGENSIFSFRDTDKES